MRPLARVIALHPRRDDMLRTLLRKPRRAPLRCFHELQVFERLRGYSVQSIDTTREVSILLDELQVFERRVARGEHVALDEVISSLATRCAAAAQNPVPATSGSGDEWLAAGQSALRLVDHSGRPIDSRLGGILHTVLLRGGAIEESVKILDKALSAGDLHDHEVRNVTTKSLKQLLAVQAPSAAATAMSEDGHWDLLRALQERGLACERHHTLVLHACGSREEVHRVLRGMKTCEIVRALYQPVYFTTTAYMEGGSRTGHVAMQVADGMFYSALHSVLMSWGDVRPAVATLAEASQSGKWSREEISATATNTLKTLGEQGNSRSDVTVWRYFDNLLLHDVMDRFHINTMLGLCTSANQIDKVLQMAGLWSPSQPLVASNLSGSNASQQNVAKESPLEGPLLEAKDQELTYELASRAWLRIGHVDYAAAMLAQSSAVVGGWGKKKLRRKVVSTLRKMYEDAACNVDETAHEKAQAYFLALHGRGLTDQHSCKLALRWCRDDGFGQGSEVTALRDVVKQAGLSVNDIRPVKWHER